MAGREGESVPIGHAHQPGTYELNQGWLFGGVYAAGSADLGFDDSGFSEVTLPHTVVPLSWGGWDPAAWEKVWIYRRHVDGSLLAGGRVFADFDGIMACATAVLNGTPLGSHQGGYLPWSIELTGHLADGDNVLALIVDARCLPVPPHGGPQGARAVDYLQPGGIYRDAALRVVPETFLADVFARPADVLSADRHVEVRCLVDAATAPPGDAHGRVAGWAAPARHGGHQGTDHHGADRRGYNRAGADDRHAGPAR